ncbi:MAG TPA: hypothetical protein VIM14_17725 [Polyangia bacterium]
MTEPNPIRKTDGPELLKALRALSVDAPDNDFRAALHRRLAAEPTPAALGAFDRALDWLRARRAWMWPVGGRAAGAFAYALLVVVHGNPIGQHTAQTPIALATPANGPVLPSFRVPPSKVAVIKLAFSAEVAVEDVTFEVTLPEGLAFWSNGKRLDERTFRWPGRLDAGENLIPIAVRGDRPGRYPVVATVEIEGRVLEHRVVLDVQKEGT